MATDPPIDSLERDSRRFWRDVRIALRGDKQDFTRLPIGRAILLLAVPIVLEMSMQALFAVVDVFFVGHLGKEPVAILGLTDSILALIYAMAMGLSMATSAMVARRVGEDDDEGAAVAAAQAIRLGLMISIPLGILGVIYSRQALLAMGASPALAAEGRVFTAMMVGCNGVVILLFLTNAIFRGAGDAALAMRALWIANGVNIVLDPILIFGLGPVPALGLEGAALATILGRVSGVLYQLRQLSKGRSRVKIERRHLRLHKEVATRLSRVSGVGMLQYVVGTASFLALIRLLSTFGEAALAGYTVAVRLILFFLLPAWGMAAAASTLVGQNLGAGNPDRAERSVWRTAQCNMAFLGMVAVVLLFFAEPVAQLFTPELAVAKVAASCLRTVSYSYLFWGFGVVMVLAFNGSGDTTTPAWINFFIYWVVQIPLAYSLAHTAGQGPQGVFSAIAICQALLALLGAAIFRRGRWKKQKI